MSIKLFGPSLDELAKQEREKKKKKENQETVKTSEPFSKQIINTTQSNKNKSHFKRFLTICSALLLCLIIVYILIPSADSRSDNLKETANPSNVYESGTYKIGTDIPAGEYVLFANRLGGYFEVNSSSDGTLESIIANENFSYNTILTVDDGTYLKITNAYAIPFDDADIDISGVGMYKVGTHIPSGEYRVIKDNSNVGGYIEVTNDSYHILNSIVSNENFENNTYITLYEKQYVKIVGAHLESTQNK